MELGETLVNFGGSKNFISTMEISDIVFQDAGNSSSSKFSGTVLEI